MPFTAPAVAAADWFAIDEKESRFYGGRARYRLAGKSAGNPSYLGTIPELIGKRVVDDRNISNSSKPYGIGCARIRRAGIGSDNGGIKLIVLETLAADNADRIAFTRDVDTGVKWVFIDDVTAFPDAIGYFAIARVAAAAVNILVNACQDVAFITIGIDYFDGVCTRRQLGHYAGAAVVRRASDNFFHCGSIATAAHYTRQRIIVVGYVEQLQGWR